METKKRLIFCLLYSEGYFCHSRNFRCQKVGDYNWLFNTKSKNGNPTENGFFVLTPHSVSGLSVSPPKVLKLTPNNN